MKRPQPSSALPPLRVRREPPTIEEAVFAAQGLTDDLAQQAEIAATLMGVEASEVMPLVEKMNAPKPSPNPRVSTTLVERSPTSAGRRTVVVERRTGRVPLGMPNRPIALR